LTASAKPHVAVMRNSIAMDVERGVIQSWAMPAL
jgi:hypothetical protein